MCERRTSAFHGACAARLGLVATPPRCHFASEAAGQAAAPQAGRESHRRARPRRPATCPSFPPRWLLRSRLRLLSPAGPARGAACPLPPEGAAGGSRAGKGEGLERSTGARSRPTERTWRRRRHPSRASRRPGCGMSEAGAAGAGATAAATTAAAGGGSGGGGGGGSSGGGAGAVQQGSPAAGGLAACGPARAVIAAAAAATAESPAAVAGGGGGGPGSARIAGKKAQLRSAPRAKKLEKLGVYSACKVPARRPGGWGRRRTEAPPPQQQQRPSARLPRYR